MWWCTMGHPQVEGPPDQAEASTGQLPSIQAEFGFLGGTCHFDPEKRTRSVLREEGVNGFQCPSLPSAHRLRNLGLQLKRAVKVEYFRVEIIAARKINTGAGNSKGKGFEGNHPILELEGTCHSGYDLINLLIFRLTSSAPTQFVNTILYLAAKKLGLR